MLMHMPPRLKNSVHNAGMGCLYINKLTYIDLKVLEEMIVGCKQR